MSPVQFVHRKVGNRMGTLYTYVWAKKRGGEHAGLPLLGHLGWTRTVNEDTESGHKMRTPSEDRKKAIEAESCAPLPSSSEEAPVATSCERLSCHQATYKETAKNSSNARRCSVLQWPCCSNFLSLVMLRRHPLKGSS